jgi:tetratricopeptide (TPR) repeat protein
MSNKIRSIKEIFAEALKYYQKKDFKTAEILCNKILSIDSNHFDSLFMSATLNALEKNFQEAKKLLLKANELNPQHLGTLNNLATAFKELKDFKKAESYYFTILKLKPDHVNANYNLGLIFLVQKDFLSAKKYLEKTVNLQPNFAYAHFTLGNVYAETKEYQSAKKSYQKVIDIRPDFAAAYNNIGLIYRALGDYDNSVASYKKTIEVNKNHAAAYNNLGRALTEMGQFEDAIKAHENALKIEPENLYHYFYLSELNKNYLDIKVVKKVEDILKKSDLTSGNQAFGNFILARDEKNKKNYNKEFDFLLKAHKYYFDTKKEKFELGLKYCFEDVMQISNFATINKTKDKKNTKIQPIFIIGVPRSGSTLVEKIIASGKQPISIGEECAVLENFINKKILEKNSPNLGYADTLRIELVDLYNDKKLISEKNNFIFTDKSLNNFFYLDLIKEIFPNAKVINCKRNYLASIMSILQNNLTELAWAHNPENIFRYFDIYFERIEKFKSKFSNFIYDLDFDIFTKNPEAEAKKLMQFCDLPWDKKCLDYYKRKDIISKTTSYQQIRKAVYKHPEERYLPYKEILNKYGKKYLWFK